MTGGGVGVRLNVGALPPALSLLSSSVSSSKTFRYKPSLPPTGGLGKHSRSQKINAHDPQEMGPVCIWWGIGEGGRGGVG